MHMLTFLWLFTAVCSRPHSKCRFLQSPSTVYLIIRTGSSYCLTCMNASSGPTCPSYITLLLYTAPIIYLYSIANYDKLGVKSSEKQHHSVTLQFPGVQLMTVISKALTYKSVFVINSANVWLSSSYSRVSLLYIRNASMCVSCTDIIHNHRAIHPCSYCKAIIIEANLESLLRDTQFLSTLISIWNLDLFRYVMPSAATYKTRHSFYTASRVYIDILPIIY